MRLRCSALHMYLNGQMLLSSRHQAVLLDTMQSPRHVDTCHLIRWSCVPGTKVCSHVDTCHLIHLVLCLGTKV